MEIQILKTSNKKMYKQLQLTCTPDNVGDWLNIINVAQTYL